MRRSLLLATLLAAANMATPLRAAETDWKTILADHKGEAVNIMTIQDPFIDAIKKISPKFDAITGAKTTTDGFGYDPLHEKEILSCSQKDDKYDVLFIDGIWLGEFVDADCIDPVQDLLKDTDPKLIAWDDYVDSFAGQAVWDGKKQCLPIAAYWQMIHYRTDLFEKAGLKAPTTFKEVMDDAKVFTNNKDFPGISGYAMNDRRGAAAGQQYFEWIYSAGGKPWVSNYPGSPDPYADQTPLLNSPISIGLAQFIKDMVPFGPKGVEQFAWDERFNSFAQGNVAMINAWSVQTPGLNDPNVSKVVGKWNVAMMPHAEGATSVPPVGGWIMCLNKYSTRKTAAWDFMRWLASPEVHKQFVLMGAPPSRHSAFKDADVLKAQPWVPTLYESAKAAWMEGRPRHPLTFQMIDAIGLQMNRATIGEASPKEAMDTAQQNVTEMLKKEGYLK